MTESAAAWRTPSKGWGKKRGSHTQPFGWQCEQAATSSGSRAGLEQPGGLMGACDSAVLMGCNACRVCAYLVGSRSSLRLGAQAPAGRAPAPLCVDGCSQCFTSALAGS